MSWLRKTPIVSLLFVVAIAAAPFLLVNDSTGGTAGFEDAREEARDYLVRNPRLEVDALGELMLEPTWLAETREAAANSDTSIDVQLPPRMLARSQARLDGLIEQAYDARMKADPAWRLGVLDSSSPRENYIAHAFVHETVAGVILSVIVLLLVGAPLERAWGSSIFAVFAVGSILAVAQAYRVLDASSGVPWSGTAGLAGALLGAYFIRGLGGAFPLPGWILLPAWLGVEAFVVRGFWLDDLGAVPWATICAAVGLGALVAGGLRLLNIESRFDDRAARRKGSEPNPIVARAARLRSDGDPYQAFDLIQAAWRDDPKDEEVCEAFYSIAVEVGQPEAAAEAILPHLQSALKKGQVERAIEYWLPLASKEYDIVLEATASVRLGEALLDAGHPQEALFSLRSALDAGVSSAHATRIVNIARDLDVSLTRQAATIALNDPTLDPQTRALLEPLVAASSADPPEPEPASVTSEPARSQLDRRVQAEHQTVETTAFPLDLDSDVESDLSGDLAAPDAHEAALLEQDLDAGALSPESLAEESDATDPLTEDAAMAGDSADVLSHWNGADSLDEDLLPDLTGSLEDAAIADALLEPEDLEAPDLGFDFGLREGGPDLVDSRDEETDTDFTPMMDSTDELTSPMAAPARGASGGAPDDASMVVFDQPTAFIEKPELPSPAAAPANEDSPSGQASADSTVVRVDDVADDEFAFGGSPGQATVLHSLRPLKALEAVPIQVSGEWIEIDADDRGKSKLPYARIQAIAVAAVSDLGPRPVLVLDFVLNWEGGASETMKSIRFRSDRFDPCMFAPDAENPLAALTAWVVDLEGRSGATCLPTRDFLAGRFPRYPSLAEYERDVLMASVEGSV